MKKQFLERFKRTCLPMTNSNQIEAMSSSLEVTRITSNESIATATVRVIPDAVTENVAIHKSLTANNPHILERVSKQKGRVKIISNSEIILQCDDSADTVFVKKSLLFVNGQLLSKKDVMPVNLGDVITFDAIPYERETTRSDGGCRATYEATCAWLGAVEPRIVDRLTLRGGGILPIELDMSKEYQGNVVAILNDVVALINVEVENAVLDVFLFRRSLADHCDHIQDKVAVGDILSLKLSLGRIFSGNEELFVMQARKNCNETGINQRSLFRLPAKYVKNECNVVENKSASFSLGAVSGAHEVIFQVSASNIGLGNEDIEKYVLPTAPKEDNILCNPDHRQSVESENGEMKYEEIEEKVQPSTWEESASERQEEIRFEVEYAGDVLAKGTKEYTLSKRPLDAIVLHEHEDFVDAENVNVVLENKEPNNDIPVLAIKPVEEVLVQEQEQRFEVESASNNSENGKTTEDALPTKPIAPITAKVKAFLKELSKPHPVPTKKKAVPKDLPESKLSSSTKPVPTKVRAATKELPKSKFCSSSKVLFSKTPLTGFITRLSNDTACVTFDKLKIFVHRDDVYIDGALSTQEQFRKLVSSGQNEVNFEAVLGRYRQKQKTKTTKELALLTHKATHVWVGKKPTLSVIASTVAPTNLSLLKETNRTFYGVVTKLCLPNMALIYLEKEFTVVVLIQSQSNPEFFITDVVSLNDNVSFTLQVGSRAFRKFLCTTQIKLVTTPPTEENTDNLFFAKDTLVNKPIAGGSKSRKKKCSVLVSKLEAWIPFIRLRSNPNFCSRLIMCEGIIEYVEDSDGIVVKHKLGRSALIFQPIIYVKTGPISLDSQSMKKFDNAVISFDAVVEGRADKLKTIYVKTMWMPFIKPPAEHVRLSYELYYDVNEPVSFLPDESYIGAITSIPLHNSAVAFVNEVAVLVPIESLVTFEKYNFSYTCIDEFLKEGDKVRIQIQEELVAGADFKYFKAIKCGRTSDDYPSITRNLNTDDPVTWQSLWGQGECYREGLMEKRHNKYYVSFTSSKRGDEKLCLELPVNKFFVDGALSDPGNEPGIKGCKVIFHASYTREQKERDSSSRGLSIVCAWIGREPSTLTVLKSVIKNVHPFPFVPGWQYEVTVTDFPLPFHIICHAGACPVVVPLNDTTHMEVAKGSLAMVRVESAIFEEQIYAVSNETTPEVYFDNVYYHINVKDKNGWTYQISPDLEITLENCHMQTLAMEMLTFPERAIDMSEHIYATVVKHRDDKLFEDQYRVMRLWVS